MVVVANVVVVSGDEDLIVDAGSLVDVVSIAVIELVVKMVVVTKMLVVGVSVVVVEVSVVVSKVVVVIVVVIDVVVVVVEVVVVVVVSNVTDFILIIQNVAFFVDDDVYAQNPLLLRKLKLPPKEYQ